MSKEDIMGFFGKPGQSRKDLIAECKEGAVASVLEKNVLWTVIEHEGTRYIVCHFIHRFAADLWMAKDVSEEMGPAALSCPLEFLGMTAEMNPAWRNDVRQHHASKGAACERIV